MERKKIDSIKRKAGVSAVVGVVLMIAITVAIAATVYVYTTQFVYTQEKTDTFILSGEFRGIYESGTSIYDITIGNETIYSINGISSNDYQYLINIVGMNCTLTLKETYWYVPLFKIYSGCIIN